MTTDTQIKDLVEQASAEVSALRKYERTSITNQTDFNAAGQYLTEVVKPLLKQVDETFDPVVKAAYNTHRSAVAAKKKVAEPLLAEEARIKRLMADYNRQVQLQREAERKRIEEQASRVDEAEVMARAELLIEQGRVDEAADLLTVLDGGGSTSGSATPVITSAPVTTGVGMREVWKFEVLDEEKVSRAFMSVDERKIRQVVLAMGEGAVEVVGRGAIRVYKDTVVSARSAS